MSSSDDRLVGRDLIQTVAHELVFRRWVPFYTLTRVFLIPPVVYTNVVFDAYRGDLETRLRRELGVEAQDGSSSVIVGVSYQSGETRYDPTGSVVTISLSAQRTVHSVNGPSWWRLAHPTLFVSAMHTLHGDVMPFPLDPADFEPGASSSTAAYHVDRVVRWLTPLHDVNNAKLILERMHTT